MSTRGAAGPESGRPDPAPATAPPGTAPPGTTSVVGVEGALRARDVSRPRPADLAAAERIPVRTSDGRVLPPDPAPGA